MPAKPFSVRPNLDDLARSDIAAALHRNLTSGSADPAGSPEASGDRTATTEVGHHGARDSRQAARERSGRDRSGRAAGAAGGRSYAFRRS